MEEKLISIISNYTGIEHENINVETNFINDIDISSFDLINLVCNIEEEFKIEIPDRKIKSFQTVQDVINFLKENM